MQIKFILGVLLFFLMISVGFSTDIIVSKDMVSYIVTLDSIEPAYLAKGSKAIATVTVTITPTDRAKYAPKTIKMYANDIEFPIDINSYSG